MASILGLINSENVDRFKSYRRTVMYYYPQGATTLTGLLTLMKEREVNDPQFYWFEKRKSEQAINTAAVSTTVAFYATAITVSGGKVTAATVAAANFAWTLDTQYAIKTAASPENQIRIGHIVKIVVTNATGASVNILGKVNAVNTATDAIPNVIGVIALETVPAIDFDAPANVGTRIDVVGNVAAEGQVGGETNITTTPISPFNYTGIKRTAYQITGTALKTSAKYDDRGIFPDEAKEAMLNHATEMEKEVLWGVRSISQVTTGGKTVITRTAAGILWYLRDWEAGVTYGNAPATTDTDDTKRIIINPTGRLSYKTFLGYLERVFRVTNNKTAEKLIIGGSNAFNVLTQMFASKVVQMQNPPAGETYGLDLTKIRVPFGNLYMKTHPLFSENPVWRNAIIIIDLPNLKYVNLAGRDTELLRDRQPNNADYLEHEYLTENGYEVNFPESCMYIQNILDWEV